MIDSHERNHAAGQSERHLNGVQTICTPLIYVGGAFLCVAVLMKEQRRYLAFKHSVNFPAPSHEALKQFIDVAETLLQPSLFLGVGRGLHGHIFAVNSATINSLRNFGKKIQSLFLAVNVDAEGIVKARDKTFTRNFIFIVNKHWFYKNSSFLGFGKERMDDSGRCSNVPPASCEKVSSNNTYKETAA